MGQLGGSINTLGELGDLTQETELPDLKLAETRCGVGGGGWGWGCRSVWSYRHLTKSHQNGTHRKFCCDLQHWFTSRA